MKSYKLEKRKIKITKFQFPTSSIGSVVVEEDPASIGIDSMAEAEIVGVGSMKVGLTVEARPTIVKLEVASSVRTTPEMAQR